MIVGWELRENSKALIIGAGPSLEKNNHWKLIPKFKGIIIATDFMYKHCINHGIMPDYVCTEENTKRIKDFFVREGVHSSPATKEDLAKYSKNVVCVCSRKTHDEVKEAISECKFKDVITLQDEELNRSSNVGLLAWKFSWSYLKCNTVVLIGMDHAKEESFKPQIPAEFGINDEFVLIEHPTFRTKQYLDPTYQFFRKEFLEAARKVPCNTINCTEGGSLFGVGITCIRFGDYIESIQH